jgi:hypothetical protein
MITDSIDDKELKWIAVHGPSKPIRLLAQAERSRREKVEVVPEKPNGIKIAPECDDCLKYATDYCVYHRDECDNGKCWNHSPPTKPIERAEIEPWKTPKTINANCIHQLQRRLEKVENEMRKR